MAAGFRFDSVFRGLWFVAGLIGGLLIAGSALGATAVGSEFQVNTYTSGHQSNPSVAVDADGDFVVVWSSAESLTESDHSIQGQRYSASGAALDAQFKVNTYATSNQFTPSVSVDADGDFVVVWHSFGSTGSDTSSFSIQGQRYDSTGTPASTEFQVNTYTTGYQVEPSVSVDADGDFVVVWESYGSTGSDTSSFSVQGQRYDSVGSAVGTEFQVNTYTTNSQRFASVSLESNGDFVVAWESYGSAGTDSSTWSIQGQRYDGTGNSIGGEFQVNSYTTNSQRHPSVSLDANGDFVVVWDSYGSGMGDSSFYSVQSQRYDSAGSTIGTEFQVNTYTPNGQRYPFVSLDSDGDFVVVWRSYGSTGDDASILSVQGQRYDSGGSAVGAEFQVNTYTTESQRHPSVDIDSSGDFVVVWRSEGSAGTDTSGRSIQGQRFAGPAPLAAPTLGPTGLLVLAALLAGGGLMLRRLQIPS